MVKFKINQISSEGQHLHPIIKIEFDEFFSQSVATREIEIFVTDTRGWEEKNHNEVIVEFYDREKNKLSEIKTFTSNLDSRTKIPVPTEDFIAYIKIQKVKQ